MHSPEAGSGCVPRPHEKMQRPAPLDHTWYGRGHSGVPQIRLPRLSVPISQSPASQTHSHDPRGPWCVPSPHDHSQRPSGVHSWYGAPRRPACRTYRSQSAHSRADKRRYAWHRSATFPSPHDHTQYPSGFLPWYGPGQSCAAAGSRKTPDPSRTASAMRILATHRVSINSPASRRPRRCLTSS
jgi:hypothetical protein